jgi:hypothetical protein
VGSAGQEWRAAREAITTPALRRCEVNNGSSVAGMETGCAGLLRQCPPTEEAGSERSPVLLGPL